MRVGWLTDPGNMDGTVGGAELTQQEFRDAAPDGVEVVDCPPGKLQDCDRYVLHNTVSYSLEDIWVIDKRPMFKYAHDMMPHVRSEVQELIVKNATLACCSPLQAQRLGWAEASPIPPPVPLERFRAAGRAANGRVGAVALGPWMNWDKGPQLATEWAVMVNENKLDFYGGGPLAPMSSQQVEYDAMPAILAKYQTFVHLPRAIEPFGRTVVEAWAAGCQIVTNRLVGARYWIEEAPERLETAAEDFWRLVLDG